MAVKMVHAYMRFNSVIPVIGVVFLLVLISGCTQFSEPGTFQRLGDEGGEQFDGKQQVLGQPEVVYKGVWMPTLGASAIPEYLLPENLRNESTRERLPVSRRAVSLSFHVCLSACGLEGPKDPPLTSSTSHGETERSSAYPQCASPWL